MRRWCVLQVTGEWRVSPLAEARGAFVWICKSSDPGIHVSMLALAMEQGVEGEPRHLMEPVGA